VPRENRVHDLRNNGVVVTYDAREYGPILAQFDDQVIAQFIFYAARAYKFFGEGAAAKFAERPWKTHEENPQTQLPWMRLYAATSQGFVRDADAQLLAEISPARGIQ